jgi:hypothetical protein
MSKSGPFLPSLSFRCLTNLMLCDALGILHQSFDSHSDNLIHSHSLRLGNLPSLLQLSLFRVLWSWTFMKVLAQHVLSSFPGYCLFICHIYMLSSHWCLSLLSEWVSYTGFFFFSALTCITCDRINSQGICESGEGCCQAKPGEKCASLITLKGM